MEDIYSFVEKSISKSKEYKGMTIESILEFPSFYCVSYYPNNMKKGDAYEDGFCKVDKKTGKTDVFSPLIDMKGFTKASQNPIYLRSKDIRRSDAFEKGKELVHSMMR